MKIRYESDLSGYKDVDCKQWRPPIFDTGDIQGDIDRLLLDAFKQGKNVDAIKDHILQDSQLIAEVRAEIEGHYNFIRDKESQKVQDLAQARLEAQRENYEKRRQEIDEKYTSRLEELKEEQRKKSQEYLQEEQRYTQAQESLESLRSSILSHQQVLNSSTVNLDKVTQYMMQNQAAATSQGMADSLEGRVADAPAQEEQEAEQPRGLFKRIKRYFRRRRS